MPPSTRSEKRHRTIAPSPPQKKSIACRPCHARKIRCSGSKPCNNCARSSDCVYPTRDRQIRVHQSYLDRILQENAELRSRQAHPEPIRLPSAAWHHAPVSADGQDNTENQILEESDWFTHTRTSDTPIWIGEVSDSAFATRFRQFASSSKSPAHFPRTQFASDDVLRGLAATNPIWPSAPRARLLIETALQFLRNNYHIVRRSEILSTLRPGGFDQISQVSVARLWALFAIGELRSSKCLSPGDSLPGLAYFAAASDAIRMINERPQLDVIETILLLANRRHSACTYVGTALRLATIMGLHINIGHSFVPNPELREHRIRVWWTVYILDRFLSSKIGLPLLISDDDISVDLPSSSPALNSEDFGDHFYFVATVRLARIAGHISRSLYVRTPQRGTFLQRVQRIQEELNQWKAELPDHIKPKFDRTGDSEQNKSSLTTLQLSFRQLLILATRPVLLFVFRRYRDDRTTTLPEHARDVANACVDSARQSCQLLSQCWVNGNFHVFDYFYVQHLFSAAVILAIAGTLGRETSEDENDEFNLAATFLQQLEQNRNPAAMEFYSHVEGIQIILETLRLANDRSTDAVAPEVLGSYPSTAPLQPPYGERPLAMANSNDAGDGLHPTDELPLDLSFLDDWIYDNALEQLCWQDQ